MQVQGQLIRYVQMTLHKRFLNNSDWLGVLTFKAGGAVE